MECRPFSIGEPNAKPCFALAATAASFLGGSEVRLFCVCVSINACFPVVYLLPLEIEILLTTKGLDRERCRWILCHFALYRRGVGIAPQGHIEVVRCLFRAFFGYSHKREENFDPTLHFYCIEGTPLLSEFNGAGWRWAAALTG